MSIYPKTLHIGFNPIGSSTNTGLTLGSMFEGWPQEKLLSLYLPSRQMPMPGDNFLPVPRSAAPIDGAVRWILGSRIPAPASDGMNNSISGRGAQLPLHFRLRAVAANLNEIGPVVARGQWLDPVERFEPQVLHSLLGGVRVMKLVDRAAARFDLPVVPHFMDDWPSTLFADGQLLGIARKQVEKVLERILERAPLLLVIGEDMKDEYERRFGKPCVIVGNSVRSEEFRASLVDAGTTDGVLEFVYLGGLHLGRDRVLGQLAAAVTEDVDLREKVRIVLHTPGADAARVHGLCAEYPGVVVSRELVPPSQVPSRLLEADGLIFVESSQAEVFAFTRLSISTKVPEYLAARKPVIAHGPSEQASIRALSASPNVVTIDSLAISDLVSAWRRAVSLAMSPDAISDRSWPIYDRDDTQERLRAGLLRAATSARL